MALGHLNIDSVKTNRKRGPTEKHFGVFSSRYSQNYILNGKFNPKTETIRDLLFGFSERAGKEAFPLPLSCVPVSVTEYASISLNKPKYP